MKGRLTRNRKIMNLNSYLKRIKISQPEKPNLSFLSKLQEQHLLSVPFENLDIHQGEKIVLAESHFTQEIICTMAIKNGRISLSDDFLTITDESSKRKTKVDSNKDFKHKLRGHFGIQL